MDAERDRWYEAQDDPIAYWREQNKFEAPWVLHEIRRNIGYRASVLDVGCGAGFLTNALAASGHQVTGLDISEECLEIAAKHDGSGRVRYVLGDAYDLPFPKESFDVVTAMDLFEHVSDPQLIIAQACRVLKPGGIFFFHTFNRSPLSWLVIVKGMRWFLKNTPDHHHVYSLFRNPRDLQMWLDDLGMELTQLRGLRPIFAQKSFIKLLRSGEIDEEFKFKWTKSPSISYSGYAKKLRFY
jgi:2-polyprenyl-6-hydroxyphenyl methylase/3-demethylubiquinone-9 3-methyltransferase